MKRRTGEAIELSVRSARAVFLVPVEEGGDRTVEVGTDDLVDGPLVVSGPPRRLGFLAAAAAAAEVVEGRRLDVGDGTALRVRGRVGLADVGVVHRIAGTKDGSAERA